MNTPRSISQPTNASASASAMSRVHGSRWLDGFSVVGLLLAAGLFFAPGFGVEFTEVTGSPSDAAPDSVPMASPTADTDTTSRSQIQSIVSGNIFSPTRRAPVSRFVAPGLSTSESTPAYVSPMAPMVMPDSAGERLPRLSAIVAMNGERQALLQLVADGAPRLYRMNDVHAGYRIVRIDSNLVVLTSRAGTRTLRLSPRAAPDTLEKLP